MPIEPCNPSLMNNRIKENAGALGIKIDNTIPYLKILNDGRFDGLAGSTFRDFIQVC